MKVTLAHRHYGIHKHVSEHEISGVFGDYATPINDRGDYRINEERLLDALPDNFLPVGTSRILLAVVDRIDSTGQVGLSRFRDWAKYFDAYCLNLIADEQQQEATDGR